MKYNRLTCLVVVNLLVQRESGVANLVNLVDVLNIVANLVVDDSRGIDEPAREAGFNIGFTYACGINT